MMPTPQDIRHRQREIRQINQDITGKILPGYIYGKFFSEKNKKNFQKYKTFFQFHQLFMLPIDMHLIKLNGVNFITMVE